MGDAIHIGENIILPLVDVSFGVAAGAFSNEAKNNGGGGMGGKITPSAILVINSNGTKLVNVKNQDAVYQDPGYDPGYRGEVYQKRRQGHVYGGRV